MNLHEAAEKGYLPTVEYLVGEGASVDEMDSRGMLELMQSKNNGSGNLKFECPTYKAKS